MNVVKSIIMLFSLLLLVLPFAMAEVDFDGELTEEEKEEIDVILTPIMKIIRFLQYASTAICVLMFINAGITFIASGGDQAKREEAKRKAVGVVIGIIVIWTAPSVVMYLVK